MVSMVGSLHYHFIEQWPPSLHNFDFRVCQNSTSNILTTTGNPSAHSCSPASLQVVNSIPSALSCLCRGPLKKQKNNKTFLLLSLVVRQFVPICPQALSVLWLSGKLLLIKAVLTQNSFACFMETHGPYFSREWRKPIGLLPSWVLSMQVTASK